MVDLVLVSQASKQKWVEGLEKGNLRVEKRVQVKVEESESEDSKSESEDTQMLLTSMAYNILSVLIETDCGVSLIALTLWAFLEVEKVQLEVEKGREKSEWELMLHVWNISMSQDYVARFLGGIVGVQMHCRWTWVGVKELCW